MGTRDFREKLKSQKVQDVRPLFHTKGVRRTNPQLSWQLAQRAADQINCFGQDPSLENDCAACMLFFSSFAEVAFLIVVVFVIMCLVVVLLFFSFCWHHSSLTSVSFLFLSVSYVFLLLIRFCMFLFLLCLAFCTTMCCVLGCVGLFPLVIKGKSSRKLQY